MGAERARRPRLARLSLFITRRPVRVIRVLARGLWRKLQWRLFVAYIVILIVTVSVQTITADFVAALSIRGYVQAHLRTGFDPNALVTQAVLAFTISLFLATAASVIAAAAASLFVAHRIVEPLKRMIDASHRIAAGRYHDRVDVSDDYEISDLAASLNSMAATLERTEIQRQELIGNVAHELRTPLTTIKGYMEGLIDGIVPANAATYTLIHEEADRLSRLVQDLQDLSRIEESDASLHVRPVRVADIVAGVVQKMRPQFEANGVALTASVPPALPHVPADYDRMQQVLLNLAVNALHYTATGGAVCIEAWVDEGAGTVQISVVDNGIGLTIARRLAEAHSGGISVESEPGHGSRFTVSLPLEQAVGQIVA